MPDAISDISLKRLPPHNLDAEQYVLGACLRSNEVFAKALEILGSDDFYKSGHKAIFLALQDLFDLNEAIDFLTLSEKLRQKNELEIAGGLEYLESLEGLAPTAEALTYHAKIVRGKRILRDLIETATGIVASSYESIGDVDSILDSAEQSIFKISEKKTKRSNYHIKEVIKESFVHIEKLFERPGLVTGVATGFADLDSLTSGLQPSDLIILAARPSMGKTSFALDIARHAALHGKVPTAVFSLEMSKEQLGIRMLCAEARVDSSKLRTGYLAKSDWPNLTSAAGRLSESPIFIDDSPSLSILDARARSRRLQAEHGIGLIIIDYLQLMQGRESTESRQLEVSEISRGLKSLDKELNVPIVALSQLNRGVEGRTDKRPLLSDLRESGAIEQDADVVAFLYRDEVYNESTDQAGIAEVLVRKQRNGPIGTAKLVFIKEYTRFENMAKYDDAGM